MTQRALNLEPWERAASLMFGAALGLAALRRRSPLASLALAGAATMLFERGITGHCRLYHRLGRPVRVVVAAMAPDCVDVSSDDSFPASDPPSWSPTAAGAPRALH